LNSTLITKLNQTFPIFNSNSKSVQTNSNSSSNTFNIEKKSDDNSLKSFKSHNTDHTLNKGLNLTKYSPEQQQQHHHQHSQYSNKIARSQNIPIKNNQNKSLILFVKF
jgi:hypothetical protein